MSFLLSIVVGTLLLACLTSSADGEQTVVRYDDGAGGQMWYRLYLPDNYDPDKSYPLTTFLHGSDGTNIKPVTDPDADIERAPQGLVDALASGHYESILIAPQLERGSWRSQDNDRLIHEAIEDVQATYGTDRQRRYLTGLSFGGFGTFHMLRAYPEYFAAGAPIAGFYSPPLPGPGEPFPEDPYAEYAQSVGATPIWAFHGSGDPIVDVRATQVVVDALRAANANIRYSELPVGGHDIWDQIYAVDQFPATVIFQLEADSASQTFQLWADLDTERNLGLSRFYVDIVGADSVKNVSPKSDLSPVTGTPLGFTIARSEDDDFAITALQALATEDENIVTGFGQVAGSLAGAGTGIAEVQPDYGAPLLLAEGTFSDLAALDFSSLLFRNRLPSAHAQVIPIEPIRNFPYAVGYTNLIHDGELVRSTGSHGEFYPWLFRQQRVPEPSSLVALGLLVLVGGANSGPCRLASRLSARRHPCSRGRDKARRRPPDCRV